MESPLRRVDLLAQPVTLWRVGHPAFPLWTGLGAAIRGGRWNSPGRAVIYTSANYSLSLLEVLVNLAAREIPRGFIRSSMRVPAGVSVERLSSAEIPGWRNAIHPDATRFGDRWLDEKRSLLLFVPSAVVEGIESNVLINPAHPEMAATTTDEPTGIDWELRLFSADPKSGAAGA